MKNIKNQNVIIENPSDSFKSKDELRLVAETKIKRSGINDKDKWKNYTKEEISQLIYNLEVHQVELNIQNVELTRVQTQLIKSKERYFDLFNKAPVGYLTVTKVGMIIESNLVGANQLMLSKDEVEGTEVSKYIHRDDQDVFYFHYKSLYETKLKQETELRLIRNDGSELWVRLQSSLIENCADDHCRMIISNIDQAKKSQKKLVESEEKYRLICTSMEQSLSVNEIIFDEYNRAVDYKILDVNKHFNETFDLKREKCIGERASTIFPDFVRRYISILGDVALTCNSARFEEHDTIRDKYYSIYAYSIMRNQFILLVSDMTERVKKEETMLFMNYHDALTSLYNRRFYEEEMMRLNTAKNQPLSITIGDINGLKLINDSFGHATGDDILKLFAEFLKSECRPDDVAARIGSDEFALLLPNTSIEETEKLIGRVKKHLSSKIINGLEVSVSFGSACKVDVSQNIQEVFKNAEDTMYQNKLFENTHVKSNIINLIMTTLFEKNKREMLHSKRVSEICRLIAIEMGLNESEVNEVKLAGLMHDIGKIGISEDVLNSPNQLDESQWAKTKKHTEIGYRILSSSKEFSRISGFVLEHHERWDGKGYPKGLKGQEISLPARIIAVADSYDAMTRERTYDTVLSEEEAKNKIIRNINTQFNPEVVTVFINKVLKNKQDIIANMK